MTDLSLRLGLRKDPVKWDKPRECIGEKQGEIQKGKYTCWRPVGRASDVWLIIRPKIKEFLDHFGANVTLVILEMYMIGRTEDSAVPTILICSEDQKARKSLRKAIKESGILREWTGVGLGDTPVLPDRRRVIPIMDPPHMTEFASHRYFDKLKQLKEAEDYEERGKLTSSEDGDALGRRLYIYVEGKKCLATGGLVVYFDDKAYQLTAGHASVRSLVGSSSVLSTEEEALDECDFDGQSDDEDSSGSLDLLATSHASQSSEEPSIWESDDDSDRVETFQRVASADSQVQERLLFSSPARSDEKGKGKVESEISFGAGPYKPDVFTSTKLVSSPSKVGNLAFSTDTLPDSVMDYALVSLDNPATSPCTVSFTEGSMRRLVTIKCCSVILPGDTDIVAITASGGAIIGTLSSTTTFLRPAGKFKFQEVYPIRLERPVALGDCGAAVIDRKTGDFYGHITAGTPGTGYAYIIPGNEIFQDIAERFGSAVTLSPAKTFAPRFPFVLPLSKRSTLGTEDVKEKSVPASNKSPIRFSDILSGLKRRPSTPTREPSMAQNNISNLFFLLPDEIRVKIGSQLQFADLLNLRLVSHAWYNFVRFNEPIFVMALLRTHIPIYAYRLYRLPTPFAMNRGDLGYLGQLRHRMMVSTKLSVLITNWVVKEIFLRTTPSQVEQFSPQAERMRRRLIPVIFTIFHFFETYRAEHLRFVKHHPHGLRRSVFTFNPIERRIMESYDDATLLNVHQIFPLFLSSFVRQFRPPAYTGRVERSLRGYVRDPPADEVYSAILHLGEVQWTSGTQGYRQDLNR
ncbi:hypothetical protein JX265_005738 [Neoarthrinium moseri]|uniref:F-box domain-containing protein n=1 Tax=Neoarthrinium moseri TaxID=1658444 RepID=A0A9Q0AMI1_9PEZI|nr:hypothetical protein JX265_005738 [Neoarthrinium moseri]